MNPILLLLSDTVPMSYPEIAIHFTRQERAHLEKTLTQLVQEGKVLHRRKPDGGVTISTFQLPRGSHKQISIFDIEGAH